MKMCRGPISIFIDYLLLPIKSIGWVMLNDNWGGQVGVSKERALNRTSQVYTESFRNNYSEAFCGV